MHISIFDLDQTLLTVNSSFRFGIYLYKKKIFGFFTLLFIIGCSFRHRLGFLSLQKLHEKAFARLFFKRSYPIIVQLARQFVEQHLDELIYVPAYQLLQEAKKAGHLIVILSSSPDFLVGPIAERLGTDKWQATIYAFDKNQQFSKISQLMQGEDKANYVQNLLAEYNLDKSDITAYSDSYLDLPFLQTAGHAVGVNPDKKLLAYCKQNQWTVI